MALEPPLGSSSRQAEEAPASNGNASSANTNGAHINGANGHSRNGSSNGNGHVASSSTPRPRACWATLMTGDSYLPGLAVFAHSLLRSAHASRYPLVVMVARGSCSPEAISVVHQLGCKVVEVDRIDPPPPPPASSGAAPALAWSRFSEVWTKLRAWELDREGFERVVLVDSDMLVRRNMDELMDDEIVSLPLVGQHGERGVAASFACTCNPARIKTYPDDWIPANCAYTSQTPSTSLSIPPLRITSSSPPTHRLLNSGLVVLQASSRHTFPRMLDVLATDPRCATYRFPDQDFLADFFAAGDAAPAAERTTMAQQSRAAGQQWLPLPYVYNALKKLRASHPGLWTEDKGHNDVKVVHYIHRKPWEDGHGGGRDRGGPDEGTHAWWWEYWLEKVKPSRGGGVEKGLWIEKVEKYVVADE